MLASSRASPYVYNKCFFHRRRMYVCERACRYNGAAPRSSLPGRRNSGSWKCLSVQVIQMETDCNISWCTFHPWRGGDCKHDNQIFLPCDAWRLAYLLGERKPLFGMAETALSGRSDFKASRTDLPPPLFFQSKFLCVKHVPYQAMTCSPCEQLGGHRASAFSIPEHLRCWLVQRGGLWGYMAAASPELQLWQKILLSCRDRVRDAVESDFCNAVPMVISWNWALLCCSLASVLCRLTVQVIAKAELIAAVLNWK